MKNEKLVWRASVKSHGVLVSIGTNCNSVVLSQSEPCQTSKMEPFVKIVTSF